MHSLTTWFAAFTERFGDRDHPDQPIRIFHAPGRVNLIGEHTDYNGGYVFPAALTFGTWMIARARTDRQLRLASANFPQTATFSLDDLPYQAEDDWMNYPKGVIKELQQSGYTIDRGYDILYQGEIPNGAGLSSSASIEVVTAYGLLAMEDHPIDRTEIALLSQKAENEYMGMKCGIMDQFAVARGKADHAVLLMCDTLDYQHVPFESSAYRIIVSNTNKRRGLVDSKYNERREQCQLAVEALQVKWAELKLLGELNVKQFHEASHLITDELVRQRAQHVVEENERVLKSVKALEAGELNVFGQYMNESHASLRDLYEVSCKELDVLVEAAQSMEGVLGSRMTGAGFGGCTVSLVHEKHIAEFIEHIGKHYRSETGLTADFYVCGIGNGVHEWKEEAR
ncbi:galactokinase [Marinicrinis sediminis]|uniref:Galactokinase n=1 Tax=Marinicrinis sediminis TaxID=1652465 RepID=A0ABW5R5W6_9BACL